MKTKEEMMRRKGRYAVVLIVLSLVLIGAQALIWRHSTRRGDSETQKANLETQRPPTEVPGVAGLTLLTIAGVFLSLKDTNSPE
jgi:hypothetical protein